MVKYFSINSDGYSVRCKMYCNDPRSINSAVVSLHGFGGSKEAKSVEKFAEKALSKYKHNAVIIFDLPCHGEDGRGRLTLSECVDYLRVTVEYLESAYPGIELRAYASSFGGYVLLKYIRDHGNPFIKTVLRCPAINMYDSLCSAVMTPENRVKLEAGKEVLFGFDRMMKISPAFLEELKAFNAGAENYMDWADDILIIHGAKDELIPIEVTRRFADDNVMEFIPFEKADHGFIDPQIMSLAVAKSLEFMFG